MKKLASATFIGLILVGCGTARASTMQIRQAQTRTVEGGYENVFRGTMTVLRDNGYIVKNTDMASGLIVAQVDREASTGAQIMGALFMGLAAQKNTQVEASVTVDKINATTQEVRMTIQETGQDMAGRKTTIRQIETPEVYQKIFNDIVVETRRREAIGR